MRSSIHRPRAFAELSAQTPVHAVSERGVEVLHTNDTVIKEAFVHRTERLITKDEVERTQARVKDHDVSVLVTRSRKINVDESMGANLDALRAVSKLQLPPPWLSPKEGGLSKSQSEGSLDRKPGVVPPLRRPPSAKWDVRKQNVDRRRLEHEVSKEERTKQAAFRHEQRMEARRQELETQSRQVHWLILLAAAQAGRQFSDSLHERRMQVEQVREAQERARQRRAVALVAAWYRRCTLSHKLRCAELQIRPMLGLLRAWIHQFRLHRKAKAAQMLIDFMTACDRENRISRGLKFFGFSVRKIQRAVCGFHKCTCARLEMLDLLLQRIERDEAGALVKAKRQAERAAAANLNQSKAFQGMALRFQGCSSRLRRLLDRSAETKFIANFFRADKSAGVMVIPVADAQGNPVRVKVLEAVLRSQRRAHRKQWDDFAKRSAIDHHLQLDLSDVHSVLMTSALGPGALAQELKQIKDSHKPKPPTTLLVLKGSKRLLLDAVRRQLAQTREDFMAWNEDGNGSAAGGAAEALSLPLAEPARPASAAPTETDNDTNSRPRGRSRTVSVSGSAGSAERVSTSSRKSTPAPGRVVPGRVRPGRAKTGQGTR